MFYHALTSGNLSPVLLWENSNPTAEFAAQTVSLDLTDYAGVIIEFKLKTNSTKINTRLYAKKNENVDSIFGAGSYNTKGDSNAARGLTVTDTGVTFAEGYSNMTENNNLCIPITIYGVKEYVVEAVSGLDYELLYNDAKGSVNSYNITEAGMYMITFSYKKSRGTPQLGDCEVIYQIMPSRSHNVSDAIDIYIVNVTSSTTISVTGDQEYGAGISVTKINIKN